MRIYGHVIRAVACLICSLVCIGTARISDQHWPRGTYGLPRPWSGCPKQWSEGFRYHDTENEHSSNMHSVAYHLSGSVTEHGVRQEFCMKDVVEDEEEREWPPGQYCIYKFGDTCPEGMKEGWIFWDDEDEDWLDGGNSAKGNLPEGVYEADTLIYFCCQTNGSRLEPIRLPITQPFYLFPFGLRDCQAVSGMKATLEHIQWDDEDRGNTDSHSEFTPYGLAESQFNTRIYFCYYTAGICSMGGAVCTNVSIDEDKLQEKSALFDGQRISDKRSKMAVDPHSSTKPSRASWVAVGIGCSVAGAIVGTAAIGLAMKHVLKRKTVGAEATGLADDDEESFPMPDHIW